MTANIPGPVVLFSGFVGELAPEVYDYGPTSFGRDLKSHDWYSAMAILFVEPTDPGTYRPVSQIAFDNPFYQEVDYIVVSVYDADDNLIHVYISASPGRVEIDFRACIGAYIIDNLFFGPEGDPSPVESATWGAIKRMCK